MKISIDKIIIPKDNPRKHFNEENLRKLGRSILTHGQLQRGIVRPKGSMYELVVGERRLRACALMGISEFEADVKDIDDVTAMELRLIENCHREDLTDAEKGDAVYALWAYDKYETIKDVAEAIDISQNTVYIWTRQSRKLSPKVRDAVNRRLLMNEHAKELVRYSHPVQNKLAEVMIRRKISSHKEVLRRFIGLYNVNPESNLDQLADEVLGIETVTIPKAELTEGQKRKIKEEKSQLAKVRKMRKQKKPSGQVTKTQVRKRFPKVDFKYIKARVSRGKAGTSPRLKAKIEPTIIPYPSGLDYTLCKCGACPLFGKHCKGRCWE